MKNIVMNKKIKVEAPKNNDGIIAYQVIEFIIKYFGSEIVCEHDTRIMEDGKQYVIGGDGFIPHDFEIVQ